MELVATLMVGKTSMYTNGAKVTSTTEYLLAVRQSIIQSHPELTNHPNDQPPLSLVIENIMCELVTLESLRQNYDQRRAAMGCQCLVKLIEYETELSSMLQVIGVERLVNQLFDRVPQTMTINSEHHNIQDMPLNKCIRIAVKSLLERPDGQYAITMVESIRLRFPHHQLFHSLNSDTLDHYEYGRLFPIPGSQEAIVYLLDAPLGHNWSIRNHSYMHGDPTLPRFGQFIFDQALIRYKANKDKERYIQEMTIIVRMAWHSSMAPLVRHIVAHQGQFQIPPLENLRAYSDYANGILKYMPAISRIMGARFSFKKMAIRSVELAQWLQSDEVMSASIPGYSLNHGPAALIYMIKSGMTIDPMFDPREFDSPDIINVIHLTLPVLWKQQRFRCFRDTLNGGSLDMCKWIIEVDPELFQWASSNIHSLVPSLHHRPDILLWLYRKGVIMDVDQLIKVGDDTGVLTWIRDDIKGKMGPSTTSDLKLQV
eukprot:gene10753-12522_t